MREQELTPWFPASVKPARVGVYEVESDIDRSFAFWDGKRFGWRTWTYSGVPLSETIEAAFTSRKRGTVLPPMNVWRGLAKEPK